MAHREDVRAFLESLEVRGHVADWGSGTKPVSKYVKGKAEFTTIDKNPDVNPDILTDISKSLGFKLSPLADHAFCMEVLEHTTEPLFVLRNIYVNLGTGGKLYLSVPFLYPEHGDEDYLRFTSQGLRYFVDVAGFKDIKIKEISEGFILEATK